MKIKSKDILKPGVVLKVVKIDFSDPEVQRMVSDTRRQHRNLLLK